MRKARRPPVEAPRPPLPPAVPLVGEDARAKFRLRSLMQDYEELLKETVAKRKRLKMGRQRILKLTDEIKFLRRRYRFLIKNSSPTPYIVKTQSQKRPTAMKQKNQIFPTAFNTQPKNREYVQYGQHSVHDSSYKDKEVAVPRSSGVLDLNQISLPDGEEGEFHVAWDPMPVPTEISLKKYLLDGDVAGSEAKLSVCRDVGSGTSRTGKRRISWQDQAVLKV